ncbi:MAG: FtsX-like permease family protein [Fimbriiglobus sp.]
MTAFRLALSNLRHDRGRAAISILGTAFAVVLIFMQLGFLGATSNTATLLYERLQFDILILSSEYLDLSRPGSLDRLRLAQAQTSGHVAQVKALSTSQGLWRNPTNDPSRGGKRWAIMMLAANPADFEAVFLPGEVGIFETPDAAKQARIELGRIGTVMLDRKSRPDFGEPKTMPAGTTTEYNGQRVELTGYFALGTGFSYTGLLLANEETYCDLNGRNPNRVTFGLVSLKPGTNPTEAVEELRSILPSDVQVLTRQALFDRERDFWISKTAVGQFFYFGVILALLVGAIFVYQMMIADIKKRLPEYATLKAIGYPFSYLFSVVVWQSLFLALAGYVGGFFVSLLLYEVTKSAANLPVTMIFARAVVVLALTAAMCVGSALVAVRKVKTADPADLF